MQRVVEHGIWQDGNFQFLFRPAVLLWKFKLQDSKENQSMHITATCTEQTNLVQRQAAPCYYYFLKQEATKKTFPHQCVLDSSGH